MDIWSFSAYQMSITPNLNAVCANLKACIKALLFA
nr:MAG TPA: hypothetical protein [Crassvirales sp.]